jgi:c-di-GMP-binding flagellar brake protein YcgR
MFLIPLILKEGYQHMKNGVERRRDARIPVGWPAFLMTSQGPINGVIEDISMGGILVLCSETIETDNEIEIVVRLAEDHEMPATVLPKYPPATAKS